MSDQISHFIQKYSQHSQSNEWLWNTTWSINPQKARSFRTLQTRFQTAINFLKYQPSFKCVSGEWQNLALWRWSALVWKTVILIYYQRLQASNSLSVFEGSGETRTHKSNHRTATPSLCSTCGGRTTAVSQPSFHVFCQHPSSNYSKGGLHMRGCEPACLAETVRLSCICSVFSLTLEVSLSFITLC